MDRYDAEAHFATRPVRDRLASLYGADSVDAQAARWTALAREAAARFGALPWRFVSAPGRTELGGNHTDHQGGRVLAAAVDLDAIACVAPSRDSRVTLESEGWPRAFELDLASLEPVEAERGSTEALIRGVAAGFAARGLPVGGFRGRMASSVLPGSGLSSSAAVEVLVGAAFDALFGTGSTAPLELALIGQEAENRFYGKPCGLMDQAASALGGVVGLDFAVPGRPLPRPVRAELGSFGHRLAVIDSGGSHADLSADYAAVPAEMLAAARVLGREALGTADAAEVIAALPAIREAAGDRAALRALHCVRENARVDAMADALDSGDFPRFLSLVNESGDSSWELLQNVANPRTPREQGVALAVALSREILGGSGAARVHGGGFAGTAQAWVPERLFPEFRERVEAVFGPGSVMALRVRPEGRAQL
ncbi:MAG: galactokinase [Spirochaetales bacterium]|nr:galactokinase [Spirochaetales bacterium]